MHSEVTNKNTNVVLTYFLLLLSNLNNTVEKMNIINDNHLFCELLSDCF
ncbi:hypothetical protein ATE84_3122 [Aquimarina sp. MAR_2010_214]|nr:hypothetical protein ATE84_3122 [Aquimarina sp. MAR_2010_214]